MKITLTKTEREWLRRSEWTREEMIKEFIQILYSHMEDTELSKMHTVPITELPHKDQSFEVRKCREGE